MLVDNITAYVDRKLFIHNLGHAAAAYLAWQIPGSSPKLAECLENDGLVAQCREVMQQAAAGLRATYPDCFTAEALEAHIEDLLQRFRNEALGDTVHRVGRDLGRKLSSQDRIVGAMRLCVQHHLPCNAIAKVYRAALSFRAPDENGELFPADAQFHERYPNPLAALADISGLDYTDPLVTNILQAL